jgi:hypothetical protein
MSEREAFDHWKNGEYLVVSPAATDWDMWKAACHWQRERDADRQKDAERYRWLKDYLLLERREYATDVFCNLVIHGQWCDMDKAVDYAMEIQHE